MDKQPNAILGTILGRSVLFGLNLGVAVYLCGIALEFWEKSRGTQVILLILAGCVLLLPVYERLAQLKNVPDQGV